MPHTQLKYIHRPISKTSSLHNSGNWRKELIEVEIVFMVGKGKDVNSVGRAYLIFYEGEWKT